MSAFHIAALSNGVKAQTLSLFLTNDGYMNGEGESAEKVRKIEIYDRKTQALENMLW